MNIFADTSVWSLAFRRDAPASIPEVAFLAQALAGGDSIFTTGLVLQELLQGFAGAKARDRILAHFLVLPVLVPDLEDHILASELRNLCRRAGVQVGTIDALFAELCIRHDLVMLSTDLDFKRISEIQPLSVWAW